MCVCVCVCVCVWALGNVKRRIKSKRAIFILSSLRELSFVSSSHFLLWKLNALFRKVLSKKINKNGNKKEKLKKIKFREK